jgi:hypothetical protein
MNKTELQVKIDQLTLSVEQSNELTRKYEGEITDLKKQLEDLNKPKLTDKQFDAVNEAIETAIGQFDFDDQDNYSIDFGIDYDGRVHCESFSFDNAYDLGQEIYNAVEELFAEAECPDEDDNQENQD